MRRCLGIGSKAKRFFFFPSPAKEKPLCWDNPLGRFGPENPDFGCEEEIFFDSKESLDSECEDDFFSVIGDLTPSRVSTPDHQTNVRLISGLDNTIFVDKYPDSKSEPSPAGRKKLGDILHETIQGERAVDATNAAKEEVGINGKPNVLKTDTDQAPGSLNGTPYCSGATSVCASEMTPSQDRKNRKGKIWKAGHCCLPSLQSFGFDEKRQKLNPGAYNS
ncbi:unnamed protein product [Musa acuminata var. zebrina]